MREVMPLFKRGGNLLGELGWDDDPYATPRSTIKDRGPKTDIKVWRNTLPICFALEDKDSGSPSSSSP